MSNSKTRVFISFSVSADLPGRRKQQVEWIEELRRTICALCNYPEEQVYTYTFPRVAPPGGDIQPEISQEIASTEHFVCVISNEYLKSVWCADEMKRFLGRTDRQNEEPVFVFSPDIEASSFKDAGEFADDIRKGIEAMEAKRDALFTDDLKAFAQETWTQKLAEARTNRHIDLRAAKSSLWKTEATEALKLSLSSNVTRSVWDYAGLAAYCLGADRYKNGGWGFSMENLASSDGDDAGLSNGPCGLNLVVLNALGKFLEGGTISDERESIFGEIQSAEARRTKRNPFRAVSDRLPYFAGLTACFQSPERDRSFLVSFAEEAHNCLSGAPQTNRWTLAELERDPNADEYCAVAYASLSHARKLKNEDPKFWKRMIERSLDTDLTLLKEFGNCVKNALSGEHVLGLMARAGTPLGDSDYHKAVRILTVWLVLAESPDGKLLLTGHIQEELERDLLASVTKIVAQGVTKKDPKIISVLLAVYAACTCGFEGAIPQQIIALEDLIWKDLFGKVESYEIVPRLGALAWASIILIALHRRGAVAEAEISNWRQLWQMGRQLRDERLSAISQLSKEPGKLNTANLEDRKRRSLQSHADWWAGKAAIHVRRDGAGLEAHQDGFITEMSHATFWGNQQQTRQNNGPASLSGVLRVNLQTKQVEMDSLGYRFIFLHPFNAITGMHVEDLDGIRREFGTDDELVRLMGETVVEKVFVPNERGYICDKCTFEKRTNEIIKTLEKSSANEPERAIDDLLVVRRGAGNERRWIHRSAIVQPVRKASSEKIISWRFVEMSEVAEKLTIEE